MPHHKKTSKTCSVILAAGQGTRMRSQVPKVLHEIGHRSLVEHVLYAAQKAYIDTNYVVIGHGAERIQEALQAHKAITAFAKQEETLGTAHAVLSARNLIKEKEDEYTALLVLFGDTPLITPETLQSVVKTIEEGADIAVLGFEAKDPTGYGRLIVKGNNLAAIREHKDANAKEKEITFCNSGVMGFSMRHALSLIEAVDNKNAQNEYYLTDCVAIANKRGLKVKALKASFEDVMGINNREELSKAEKVFQKRQRSYFMQAGVTMQDPESIYLSADTLIAPDVLIEPNCYFGKNVSIEKGAHIRGFSYLEGAHIKEQAIIGPYARIRPNTTIGKKAKIGNFCEVKKAVIGDGAKVNHLSYIGDAQIGVHANIGAGTITCNYDGFDKYHTSIGAHAFIGSNSALIAPVNIEEGAYVGSGSVITEDVPQDALSLARSRQITKENWAAQFKHKKRQ